MKHIKLFILTLFVSGLGFGQTKIAELNFETAGGYSTSITEFTDGQRDYFIRTDGTDFNNGANGVLFSNIQGTYYFAAQDINGEGATLPVSLLIDDIDITNYSNLEFRVHLAEDDHVSNNGATQHWDNGDYVHFTSDIDNSGTSSNLIWIEGSGGTNSIPRIDADFNNVGEGTEITDTFTQFTQNITGAGTLLDIEIIFNLNAGQEDIAIDNIEIWGILNCQNTVTWNGSTWDNGTGPTSSDNAIINGAYNTSTSSFTACSLDITSNGILTISANSYVQIINDIDNSGQIIIADEGSLVQVNESAIFTNSSALTTPITVARRTAPIVPGTWYEYTYWSSPVPEATLETLLPNTSAVRKFSFDASQFHDNQAEIFNTGVFNANARDDIDDDGNDWQYASGIMTPALGYAATLGPNDLLSPGGGSTGITKNFEGNTLNTGIIDVTVNRNDLSVLDNNWNLIGNPYPSAIDVSLFFAQNQQGVSPSGVLEGSIYLWSHSTPPSATTSGNEDLNFSVNDYAIINLSANIAGEDGLTPNNTIGSCQGFFVLYSESAATTTSTVRFTNAMRMTGDNQQFYRTNDSNQDNKFWLNLTSDNGVFSQLAVAYVNGATNDDDGPSYDARRFYNGGSAMLVSYAQNSTVPLAIQGKQPEALDSNEVITLGLKTGITSPTIYSISIDHFEGDFLSNNAIYLKDNLLNTYQDLTLGDYSFTSEMGEFNTRFEIVFTQPSLGIDEQILATNNLLIFETENDNVTFKLNSNSRTIKQIKIVDVLGREVYNLKGNSSTETYNLSNLSKATFFAKIELDNGMVITKKAIKK